VVSSIRWSRARPSTCSRSRRSIRPTRPPPCRRSFNACAAHPFGAAGDHARSLLDHQPGGCVAQRRVRLRLPAQNTGHCPADTAAAAGHRRHLRHGDRQRRRRAGFADLPLRVGANRYFVNSSTGNDANTCVQAKSAATPKATIGEGLKCVTDLTGDQVLVAEGTSYSGIFAAFESFNGRRGFSALYPTVIQSYNPAASGDTTQYGRATGTNRPSIDFGGADQISNGGGGHASEPAGKLALRGLKFTSATEANLSFIPTPLLNGFLLVENSIFDKVALVHQQEGSYGLYGIADRLIVRNSSFYGQYGYSTSAIYVSSLAHVTLEDNFFYHVGWKEGVSRDSSYTIGGLVGADGRNHDFYVQEDTGSISVRRNLHMEASYDTGQARASAIVEQNVFVDNPINALGGSGTRYYITKPFGADLSLSYNFTLGSVDAYTGYGAFIGMWTTNGRNGSASRYNILARSPHAAASGAFSFTTDALWNLPSYMDFRSNISYLRTVSGRTKNDAGGNFPAQNFATYSNNIWDDPPSGSNVNASSYSPTNAYTDTALYAALTATFPSITDKASLIAYAKTHPEAHVQRTMWTLAWAGYNGHAATLEDLTTKVDITRGWDDGSVFINTSPGTTLSTVSGQPTGITLDGNTHSWQYDGNAGIGSSGTWVVRESNGVTTHDSSIPWSARAPPVLTSPTSSSVTSTTATIGVTTDASDGVLAYIVDKTSNNFGANSHFQGRRGDVFNAFSTITYFDADKSGNQAISSTGTKSANVTGLTPSSQYWYRWVHKNAAGTYSADNGGTFTTAAGGGAVEWSAATSHVDYALSGTPKLTATTSAGSGGDRLLRATTARAAGYYFEVVVPSLAGGTAQIGLATGGASTNTWVGNGGVGWSAGGSVDNNGGGGPTYSSYTGGDVLGFYVKDVGGGVTKVFMSKNGTWQGGSDPATNTGGVDISSIIGTGLYPAVDFLGIGSIVGRFSSGFGSLPSGATPWG
jgi:hypothetical protein